MRGQKVSAVLYTPPPLQGRGRQVSGHACQGDQDSQDKGPDPGRAESPERCRPTEGSKDGCQKQRHHHRGPHSAEKSLPGFCRGNGGSQWAKAQGSPPPGLGHVIELSEDHQDQQPSLPASTRWPGNWEKSRPQHEERAQDGDHEAQDHPPELPDPFRKKESPSRLCQGHDKEKEGHRPGEEKHPVQPPPEEDEQVQESQHGEQAPRGNQEESLTEGEKSRGKHQQGQNPTAQKERGHEEEKEDPPGGEASPGSSGTPPGLPDDKKTPEDRPSQKKGGQSAKDPQHVGGQSEKVRNVSQTHSPFEISETVMKDTATHQEIPEKRSSGRGRVNLLRHLLRNLAILAGALLLVSLLWWGVGRITADSRRLVVHHSPEIRVPADPGMKLLRGSGRGALDAEPAFDPDSAREADTTFDPAFTRSNEGITILAWNIAHGRGDVRQGWMNNWRGGTREQRVSRLMEMARTIREADADIVVLNEVDFRAQWSHNLDQGEILARGAGYPFWVEQRNYDFQLPFLGFAFGNALLSRLPLLEAEWVEIPPHSTLEALVLGAKSSSLVRLETPLGRLTIVLIHLEYRDRATRMAAAPVFDSLRALASDPVILAGDFNSAPSGWPGTADHTLLDSLLTLGWTSPRAEGDPLPEQFTFPTPGLLDARDWILVEAPMDVGDVRVLHEAGPLSDHTPVLAAVTRNPGGGL